MKKIAFIFCLGFCLALLPGVVLAVTFDSDTNILVESSGITVTIQTGSTVDSITVNDTNFTLTMSAGQTVTIHSSERRTIEVTPANTSAMDCTNVSYSSRTITTAISQTFTVSPSATSYCSTPGGGSTTTSGGGGGGGGGGVPVVKPSNLSVSISSGAAETASRDVTLQIKADNATLMMISNLSDFSDVSAWQDYATSVSWQLTAGDAEKTVYVKFRSSAGGESDVVSDKITLNSAATPTAVTPTEEVAAPTSEVAEGNLVKEPGKPAVYLIQNGRKRPIPSGNIFEANGYKWAEVKTVDLAAYETDADVTYPPDYNFADGMLVKGSNNKVYVISGGKRRWIETETVFNALGYWWSKINEISDAKIAEYAETDSIVIAGSHPDGTLVKYVGSSKVYVIDGGKKRWITSEAAFNTQGYKWDYIIEIVNTETYVDGADVGTGEVLGVETAEPFVSLLELGDSGQEVRALQNKLIDLGFFPLDVKATGYFGDMTEKAVMAFQKAHGIEMLGIVGPKTRAALNQL